MEHKVSFHEATFVTARREGRAIALLFEGAHLDSVSCAVTVRLNGIQSIARDGIEVDGLIFEYEDGEVLTLEQKPTGINLIVEWTDFRTHRSVTRSYDVECDSVNIVVNQ